MARIQWSERDLERLRDVVRNDAKRPRNTTGRGPVEPYEPASPEGYLARTRAGGIAAATVDESCGITSLGYAYCDVYEVVVVQAGTGTGTGTGTVGEVHEVRQVPGFYHRTYNPSVDAVPENTFIFIEKDTTGRFWVVETYPCTPSGTGTGTGTGTSGTGTSGTGNGGNGTGTNGTGGNGGTGTGGNGGTGTGGTGGNGTGTSGDCTPVTVQETDVRCEDGYLNKYTRDISLNIVAGCLTKATGEWVFAQTISGCDPSAAEEPLWFCMQEPGFITGEPAPSTWTVSTPGPYGSGTCGSSCDDFFEAMFPEVMNKLPGQLKWESGDYNWDCVGSMVRWSMTIEGSQIVGGAAITLDLYQVSPPRTIVRYEGIIPGTFNPGIGLLVLSIASDPVATECEFPEGVYIIPAG